ncbi:MAG TPA: tetratricopeptide repeat protein, partial [Candidatus Eisenbacteria bacterium]|nr:tetratricopeptide repeat protein [Candidatus Eisenbacteria bacterium]
AAAPRRGRRPASSANPADASAVVIVAIAAASIGFGAVLWPRVAIWRDEAALYGSMLRDTPDSPHVQAIMGAYLYRTRDLMGAAAHYRRAIEIAPEHAGELLLNLVAAEDEMGRRDSAYVHVRRLTAIRPDYAPGWYALGNLYAHSGMPDSAVVAYREALRLMPELAQAENNMGAVLEQLGRYDAALAAYRRSLAALPGFPDAANNLRRLSEHLGRPSGLDSLAAPDATAPTPGTLR